MNNKPTRSITRLSISALLMLAGPASVSAAPLDARIGVGFSPVTMGLEADLKWKDTPFGLSSRFGAMGFPGLSSEAFTLQARGNWWTTWGHYTRPLDPRTSVGLLLGFSQSWFFYGAPIPFRSYYASTQPFVPLAGVFFQHTWDNVSLRVAPSLTLVPPNYAGQSPSVDFWEAAVLGPPLIEVGFRLGQDAELRLRPSLTPVAYTRTF